MAILSCQGHSGTISFTDIEIIPKPDNMAWKSSSELVATCLEQIDTSVSSGESSKFVSRSEVFKTEEVLVTPIVSNVKRTKSVTLGTHVQFEEMSILDWTLKSWKEPVSIVILVPVHGDRIKNKLDTWKK